MPPDAIVLLDEVYIEFVAPEYRLDVATLVQRFPNVVVLRTFSKAYGLARLRVGYGLAASELAKTLWTMQLPFGSSPPLRRRRRADHRRRPGVDVCDSGRGRTRGGTRRSLRRLMCESAHQRDAAGASITPRASRSMSNDTVGTRIPTAASSAPAATGAV